MGAEVFAALAFATTAAGTVISANAQKKAAKKADRERARQRKIQQEQQEAEQQRRVRQNVRRARQARAEALSSAVQQGVSFESSSVAGGTGSISSQLGSNLGFINSSANRASALGDSIFNEQRAIQQGRRGAARGNAIAGIGSSVFDAAGGFSALPSFDVFGSGGGASTGTQTVTSSGGRTFNIGGAGLGTS